MPDPTLSELLVPEASIVRIAQNNGAVTQVPLRDAELCDMLAIAQLEPRLESSAPTLTLVATTRPGRKSIGG